MNNPQRNQRIRVKEQISGYQVGRLYTVSKVDPVDCTLTAKDAAGKEGGWVSWDLCESGAPNVSWEWLKHHLPGDALELLLAFNGLDGLKLREEIRDQILMELPSLKDRVLKSQIAFEEQVSRGAAQESLSSADEGFSERLKFDLSNHAN